MKRRYASPWLLILFAYALLPLICGCASTGTILRVGVNADITDKVRGCDRKHDPSCGRAGARDLGIVELIYAPGLRLDRKLEPYCSWLHNSTVTAGRPFNDRLDQVIDSVGCGGFIQFGGRP